MHEFNALKDLTKTFPRDEISPITRRNLSKKKSLEKDETPAGFPKRW